MRGGWGGFSFQSERGKQQMICVTVGRTRHKTTIAEYLELAAAGAELVELRLDYIARAVNLKRLLEQRPCAVVATCRRREDGGRWLGTEEDRQMLLRSAIATGVDYIDLEWDIAANIPRYGRTKRIISYHNFDETPANLADIHKRLIDGDADIAKIATQANSVSDWLRMVDLMRSADVPTIGICMGDIGAPTRILTGRFGAPFSYAASRIEKALAPGMIYWKDMQMLYRYNEINADTQLFGVIADPVAHSFSPLIHNTAFAKQQLNACYLPFRVPPADLERFLDACPKLGIRGLSVTIPHKESVMPLLTQMEAAADGIGAANTIIFDGNRRIGYNTDYRAAMECIAEAMGVALDGEKPFRSVRCFLLGAGGVSRAIGWGLRQKGAEVLVSGRSAVRANRLAQAIGGTAVDWEARHEVRCQLLINGTPLGMHPDVDRTPYDGTYLKPGMTVFETIYNPEQTLLIKHAKKANCKVITGVDMFVRQASYQYRLFTGQEPPQGLMHLMLKKATSPVRYQYEEEEQQMNQSSSSNNEDD